MEWANTPQSGYSSASHMGILEEATAHLIREIATPGSWNKNEIIQSNAEFTTLNEWRKKDSKSYSAAQRLNLLNDIDVIGHLEKNIVVNKKWTKDIVLKESKKYASVSDWKKNSSGSYKAARSEGYFEEASSHMETPKQIPKWTAENILNEAKKYKTKKEWRENSGGSYSAAQKKNLLKDASAHMRVLNPKGKWSETNTIINEARKYSSKSEWQNKSVGSYEAAKRLKIFEKASKHMKRPQVIFKWTKENILQDAKRFKYKTDWIRTSRSAYDAAKSLGCMEEATQHMPNKKRK